MVGIFPSMQAEDAHNRQEAAEEALNFTMKLHNCK